MASMMRWATMGLTAAVAGWCLASGADAGERPARADRRENVRDRREDVRDRREDVLDRAAGDNGLRDRAEDVRDRREDVRDRREDLVDRQSVKARIEEREQTRENVVDRRENRQDKRIEHGINKGYLTPDEAAKLQDQQKAIADMEASFKGDGRLSPSEFRQLQQELNEASRCIWAEKRDADGNPMPVYRLGKDVRLDDGVAQKLAGEGLSKEEARAYAKDFHHMLALKHRLATEDLPAAERARLQAEYNDLLNRYFYTV